MAFGDPARQRAADSIRSLGRVAPGIPAAVVSDQPVPGAVLIERPDADPGARTYKTSVYDLSPFDLTLYLDADTILLGDPTPGFDALSMYDLVIGQDVNRVFEENRWRHLVTEEVEATKAEIGTGHHMYFNSGVMFFRRNERVAAMMRAWHEEWARWGQHDQMALLRAIHRCPVRILPMREPWNTHRRRDAKFVFHNHRSARREGSPR